MNSLLPAKMRPSASPSPSYAPTYSSVASDEVELINYPQTPVQPRRHDARSHRVLSGLKNALTNSKSKRQKSWHLLYHRLLSRVIPCIAITCLLVLLILMSVVPAWFTGRTGAVCQPDASFLLSFNSYSPWNVDGLFAINIKFGSFTFGQAKVIDVTWDIIIGRGGQVFLAIFTYVVFTKGLTCMMQTASVPYETFKAITLQNDTITGVMMLVKNLPRVASPRDKATMLWIIIAAGFVLFVPTWLAAMTGYVADILPFVEDNSGSFLPIDAYQPVIYTIHDGARLETLANDAKIAVPWKQSPGQLSTSNSYDCYYEASMNDTLNELQYDSGTVSECKWLWAVSKYVYDYGFFATSDQPNTTFHQPNNDNLTTTAVTLSPALNISAHFATSEYSLKYYSSASWFYYPSGVAWKRPNDDQYAFYPGTPILWHPESDTTYDITEFNQKGSCQPATGEVKYKWGFSFLLLQVFVVALMIWILGMWIFYANAVLFSHLNDRTMGYERAVLDLSQSMQRKIIAEDIDMYSNKELLTLVKGNILTYNDLPFDKAEPTLWTKFRRNYSFWQWVKDEKWWLFILIGSTPLFIASWKSAPFSYDWSPWFSPFPGFGALLVILVGRETYGRWTLFAFFMALFVPLNIWWAVTPVSNWWY